MKTTPRNRLSPYYDKYKISRQLDDDCPVPAERKLIETPNVRDWDRLRAAAQMLASEFVEKGQRIERMKSLESRLASLEIKVAGLSGTCSIQATIASLAPEPYVLLKNIHVTIQATGDDFTATFFDANIGMSGDTPEEAAGNLKSLIVDMFESLEEEEAKLGPGPAKQLATLREFIQRRQ